MPGAQDRWDQLAEPSVRSQDALTHLDPLRMADRPERGSLADLRQRLERLPAGHPSSPYNDDFSRKPPAARLKDLELPLHGSERDANGSARQHQPATAGEAAATEKAPAATQNGSGGHGADAFTPVTPALDDRPGNDDTADDWLGLDQGIGQGIAFRPADGPGAADGSGEHGTLGTDNGSRAGDGPGATNGTGASRWSRADPWSSSSGGLSTTDHGNGAPAEAGTAGRTGADDEASAEAQTGAARWSGTDDLSTTAEWSRTSAGRASTRDWGGPSGDWGGSADQGGADGPTWLEPGPPAETDPYAPDATHNRFSDEPRIGLDGSWEWNGRYLTPDEGRLADEALSRLRTAEGRNVFGSYGHSGLTPAMRRLEAQLEHGRLAPETERYALKPPDSFKERLADLIQRHPDKTAEELSHEVHDGIRYAYIFDAEHYADATLQVHSRLKGQGFELEARRNSWRNPEYKGVNTRWRDPAHDVVFEVQFHTASSWAAKQGAQASYEQILDPATPPTERARLRAKRAEISAAIPAPPRSAGIPDYRKEAL